VGESGAEAAPTGGDTRCTIVVPCYNEADRLQPQKFAEFLAAVPNVGFLFVNDGSKDKTQQVLEALRREFSQSVEVLNKPVNGGKSEAVRDGMLRAIELGKSGFVGFWDADLATPLEAIPQLLEKLVEIPQLQMVLGSRIRLLGREIHRKASRHYLGRIFATVASAILHLPIYDTQCGAKIFRVTPELSQILSEPFVSRWVFDVELIARFIVLKGRNADLLHDSIYEFPLFKWEDVAGSKVQPADFLRAFVDMVKIRQKYLR
jgi:glycosyltransferase involved in cell wall biosynthesis